MDAQDKFNLTLGVVASTLLGGFPVGTAIVAAPILGYAAWKRWQTRPRVPRALPAPPPRPLPPPPPPSYHPTRQEVIANRKRKLAEDIAIVNELPLPEDEKEIIRKQLQEAFIAFVEKLL